MQFSTIGAGNLLRNLDNAWIGRRFGDDLADGGNDVRRTRSSNVRRCIQTRDILVEEKEASWSRVPVGRSQTLQL